MIGLLIIGLAAVADPAIEIPSGGRSGPAYGVSAFDTPQPGTARMDNQYEGATVVVYDFGRGWDQLFPMGWKPPCGGYDLSKAYAKRYARFVRAQRKAGLLADGENTRECVK